MNKFTLSKYFRYVLIVLISFIFYSCGGGFFDDISNNIPNKISNILSSTLKQTGQTKSYKDYDDGYYQEGIANKYTRSNDIVTDTVTNLQWQDNNDTKNNEQTWNNAKKYCNDLSLGGYNDWELPTIKELLSIVDISGTKPFIDSLFQNIISNPYWSSSSDASNSSLAWDVDFSDGYTDNYEKTNSNYVRCVRGRQ